LIQDNNIQIIDKSKIKFDQILGGGGQGMVYEGIYEDKEVAYKEIRMIDLKSIIHEFCILSKASHKCFAKFYGAVLHDSELGYVTQFIKGKPMNEIKMVDLPENSKLKIILDLSDAFTYLHKLNIAHRDLKPENLLCDNDNVYLIDFGLSKKIEDSQCITRVQGTINYIAPELLDFDDEMIDEENNIISSITTKVDVWSFGCLISYIYSGYTPWCPKYKDNSNIIERLLVKKSEFPIPENITNKAIVDIIKMCTNINPKKRATMEEVHNAILKLK